MTVGRPIIGLLALHLNTSVNYNHNEDINPKIVIIGGDSAGGNLSMALTGLLIKYG